MGWSSGTELMAQVINAVERQVESPNVRRDLYIDLIEAFTDHDWDCVDECLDISKEFDKAAKKLGYIEEE